MAIEVFNRHENKYRLDERTFALLQARLSEYMLTDAYNEQKYTYQICNIYYDTDDDFLIRTSLSKPTYKEKLRLRSYGTPKGDAKVYVEIKKKLKGVVNKRRSAMRLGEAYDFLSSGEAPELQQYMNGQVINEISYMLSKYRLIPKVYLSYERRAFFGAENSDLRVSFDTNIITRRHDLRLESGIYGESLLPDGVWLMEIKSSGSFPLWLARMLSELEIYPTGFSKYGTEYRRSLVAAPRAKAAPVYVCGTQYAPGMEREQIYATA
jgi:SPX domain protein involved in polyphosphate accumulation